MHIISVHKVHHGIWAVAQMEAAGCAQLQSLFQLKASRVCASLVPALRVEEIRGSDIGTRAGLFEVLKLGDEFFTFIVDCEDPKACTILLRGASKDVLNEVRPTPLPAPGPRPSHNSVERPEERDRATPHACSDCLEHTGARHRALPGAGHHARGCMQAGLAKCAGCAGVRLGRQHAQAACTAPVGDCLQWLG